MRKNIVAGNWKMNKTIEEGLSLASEVVNMVKDEVSGNVQVIWRHLILTYQLQWGYYKEPKILA